MLTQQKISALEKAVKALEILENNTFIEENGEIIFFDELKKEVSELNFYLVNR